MQEELLEPHFDKGNGAMFQIEHEGHRVHCFVSQNNAFFLKKGSPGQSFPEVFERYTQLVAEAARISITRQGVSSDVWGNLVTEGDLSAAQEARRRR